MTTLYVGGVGTALTDGPEREHCLMHEPSGVRDEHGHWVRPDGRAHLWQQVSARDWDTDVVRRLWMPATTLLAPGNLFTAGGRTWTIEVVYPPQRERDNELPIVREFRLTAFTELEWSRRGL